MVPQNPQVPGARLMFKRGLVYETLVFVYAFIVAWIFFGEPFKGFLMTLLITATKYPIYFAFHHFWKDKKSKTKGGLE
jgi:hypothetical protein